MEEVLYRYNPWWEGITDHQLIDRPKDIKRLLNNLKNKQIILVTGLRRIGKTSLLKLVIYYLIKDYNVRADRLLYISLDDYNLKDRSILDIVDEFRKLHNISFREKIFLFLDEVAYKSDYEIQLKNLYDAHNVKIFASSPSSSILTKSKSFITGRSIILEILPLDFEDYLAFKQIEISKADAHLLDNHFEDYLRSGGIPEYVLSQDPSYLQDLVNDIIMKDIAAANNIRQTKVLQDFFMLLMERSGKQMSLNKIASVLQISVSTAYRFFDMFQHSYLIFPVARYGKTNERVLAPKKIYSPDTGIRNHYTGFRDLGSIFENYVFLRLKEYNPEYIYKNKTELDFRLSNGFVVEVKYHDKPLSDKQGQLFQEYDQKKRMIVRNKKDLDLLIEKIV